MFFKGIVKTAAFATLMWILAATGSRGVIYDDTVLPDSDDTYTTALFRIYLPESAPLIRGIYFYVDPYNVDSRYIAAHPDFQALCGKADFALMGAQLDSRFMETGIGKAVLRALQHFAGLSSHPELEFSTIFFEGYSWGGQFSYHFAIWLPERVIGFVTQKGGYHDTGPAGAAVQVPGYLFVGENDEPYRIENLTGIFKKQRLLGARWILAMQPDAGHERITDRNLLDNYFQTVSELRLPGTIPVDRPVQLIVLDETESWLGNLVTQEIGDYICYNDSVETACWFPSSEIGKRWQVFVSDTTVTDTIPCGSSGIDAGESLHSRLHEGLRAIPNPCHSSIAIHFYLPTAAEAELSIYDAAGRVVLKLIDDRLPAGAHTVRWQGSDAGGDAMKNGIYFSKLKANSSEATGKIILIR
ncbi:MAG: T9SS type A sorting domain-containing protein [Candidatus Eisenbacteria bacterium]|uniref:T9SS type A sorting domain-containing protein n=1 Tax=Eiseniibacteriota bacterium TaxID=2212470 RepID=A0A948RUF2_UNCEI|nr:T9SS type A sorting domain-containing protein [Candidatus Eisenbacteria bacterium]MBU1947661.1 T9SS type A sorting domain-containing protein [Candidatus Eisenbacteria bacterium]MBU2690181.1 T9SS type A sorting domain-containing protein [Candidatus Eisenbacteria bacterium]